MNELNISPKAKGCCTPTAHNQKTNLEGEQDHLKELPVAILGAGPVGLAAAAHLESRGESFFLLEAGNQVGANILSWGHVRLFSPWRYNIDKAASVILKKHDWNQPDLESLPTGNELVEQYLQPLSNLPEIQPFINLNTKVLSIGIFLVKP